MPMKSKDNLNFPLREQWAVAVWAYRAAWKINGPTMLICSLISLLGSVLPAFLISQSSRILDDIVAQLATNPDLVALIPSLVIIVVCLFGASLYYLLPDLMSQYVQLRFDKGSYHMMIDALKDIPIHWFDKPEFVTDMERYQSSTNITWLALQSIRLAGYIGATVSFLVLAASVSMPIFLVILVLAGFYIAISIKISIQEYLHWWNEGDSKKRQAWYRQVLTASWHAKYLRVLSAGPGFIKKWKEEASGVLERRKKFDESASKKWDKIRILGFVSQAAIVSMAFYFLVIGSLSIGSLLLFISLASNLTNTLMELGTGLLQPLFLLRTNRYFKQFFDKDWKADGLKDLSVRTAIDENSGKEGKPTQPKQTAGAKPPVFEMKDVCYEYQPGKCALKNIDLKVNAGEIMALVGYNGAGKSTLTKILLGFYSPTRGQVLFKGKPYNAEMVSGLIREVGASFQDFHHFEMSIRENVAFGYIQHLNNDKELIHALGKAGGDAILKKAGNDLGHYVGRWYSDDGLELSGGEWQRLATSRAFISNRPILIMDEPASMLDAIAEIRQFDALRENIANQTAILISHRIGFARMADRIVVLNEGELIEEGTHDQLMAAGGHYAKLFTAQAEWYDYADKELETEKI